jgi:cytochrome P450
MDEYLYRIIRERRALTETCQDNGRDLLGSLIHAGLDDNLIRDQLLTMLIAGHDTGTALMAWTLYLLGAHPQAMRRARDEAKVVLGTGPPGPKELSNLEYLGRVIKESLRLYPPIHLGSRLAATDL